MLNQTVVPDTEKGLKMNKNVFLSILSIILLTMLTGCGSKKYAMYSPEEVNLQSLSRITDNEDNKFDAPFGGDNGRELYFAVRDKRGSSNIYRKENPLSAAMSPKTNGRNINSSPSYSPAINQVAYAGRQEGAFVNDIFMIDATQGAAIRRVTNTPSEVESHPCLSYDGKTIIYQRVFVGGSAKDSQIWRQDLRTESPTLLSQGLMPSISHDGRSIVFVRYTPDGYNTCLVTMNANGQNQTELTDAKMGVVSNPRFSPNDRQIVFQCKKKDKRDYDLYVINIDGTNLTQLTFNKSYDAEPYWANDGNIYFSSDRGGRKNNFQIWRFQMANTTSTPAPFTPQAYTSETYSSESSIPEPAPITQIHTVAQGETITQIAQRYGVTVRDIVKWNNLTTMTLRSGQRLRVSK